METDLLKAPLRIRWRQFWWAFIDFQPCAPAGRWDYHNVLFWSFIASDHEIRHFSCRLSLPDLTDVFCFPFRTWRLWRTGAARIEHFHRQVPAKRWNFRYLPNPQRSDDFSPFNFDIPISNYEVPTRQINIETELCWQTAAIQWHLFPVSIHPFQRGNLIRIISSKCRNIICRQIRGNIRSTQQFCLQTSIGCTKGFSNTQYQSVIATSKEYIARHHIIIRMTVNRRCTSKRKEKNPSFWRFLICSSDGSVSSEFQESS